MLDGWTLASNAKPPEGEIVEVISEGGMNTLLKYRDNLWWLPDGSMSVYYSVKYWRLNPVYN